MRKALQGILVNSDVQYIQTIYIKDMPNRFDEFFGEESSLTLAMSRFQVGGRWYAVVLDDNSYWKAKGQFYIEGMRSPCPGKGIILGLDNDVFSDLNLTMSQVRRLLRWDDAATSDQDHGAE